MASGCDRWRPVLPLIRSNRLVPGESDQHSGNAVSVAPPWKVLDLRE